MSYALRFLEDFRVPVQPSYVEWAEENLEFPPSVSANEPGKFSTRRRPYMREIIECFRDPGVTDIVMPWGAQLGKTTALQVGLCCRIEHDPQPCLWVMPTDKLGKSWVSTRWHPLIKANAVLRAHMPLDLDRFKLEEMHFDGMTMNVVGSNSPTNLASRPAAIVIQDEPTKYPGATLEEASAMDLADLRTKDFNLRAKRVKASTPTTTEHQFWQQYLATDQRHFYVHCLDCGEPYVMEHHRRTMRWSDEARTDAGIWRASEVARTARYHCPHCDAPHDDGMKLQQLLGKPYWHPHNPEGERRRRGYHLSSFYSPNVPFGTMAVEYIRAYHGFNLQNYYNGWLALPWENRVFSIGEKEVLALRRPGFAMGKIPVNREEIHYLVLTADPGDTATHWMVTAIMRGGETLVVDWGTVLAVEDLLLRLREMEYTCADGTAIVPITGLVDSGDRAIRIYDFCRASRGFFHPTKGSSASWGTWTSTQPKSHPDLTLYTYIDYQAKLMLYESRIGKRLPPLIHIPENAGTDLIDGLSGQTLIIRRRHGAVIREFKKLPGDHYGDCLKLAQFSWWVLKNEYEPAEDDDTPKEEGTADG